VVNIRKKPTLQELADYLDDNARSEMDNEAAAALRRLTKISRVAHEMILAKTHEASRSAYCEMVDLMKGKGHD
jgi:hypothetical protein